MLYQVKTAGRNWEYDALLQCVKKFKNSGMLKSKLVTIQ